MNDKFREIGKLLRQMAQARQDTRATIAKLEAQRKDYSAEYAKAVLEPQITKTRAGLQAAQLETFEKLAQLLEELSQAAVAKQAQLDLNNVAWANALKLIELSGPDMDTETILKINASFAGDQAALRALRDVYKAHKVVYNGGLDQQIYDPESAFGRLRDHLYPTFLREGSLNALSTAISKVAALEGIQFPKMVDEAGAESAMRTAAGLPPE